MNNSLKLKINYPEKSSKPFALAGVLIIPKLIILLPSFLIMMAIGWLLGILSWLGQFSVLITGQYPKSLFEFIAGYFQFELRVKAFLMGLTDTYPPFTISLEKEEAEAPVELKEEKSENDTNV